MVRQKVATLAKSFADETSPLGGNLVSPDTR
jgi:hypothetical protein